MKHAFLLCLLLWGVSCASTPAFTPTPDMPTAITLPAAASVDALESGLATRGEDGLLTFRLVQRPCRFVEAEPGASFAHKTAKACAAFNKTSFASRTATTVVIPAGKVRIEVSSQDVSYELGFWIRSVDAPEKALAQGGGIVPGVSKTYDLELAPGRYVYACPLNPTPDYILEVR